MFGMILGVNFYLFGDWNVIVLKLLVIKLRYGVEEKCLKGELG